MIRHHHYQVLERMLAERNNNDHGLDEEGEALKAAVDEFKKSGSTLRDLHEDTLEVETKLYQIVQQTHIHPELASRVLIRIFEMCEGLKGEVPDFFKEKR